MSHGLPVISHTAPSMGQKEQIADAGKVVENYNQTNHFIIIQFISIWR